MEKYKEPIKQSDAQKAIRDGIILAAEFIEPTLGAKGRKIVLDKEFGNMEIIDDGASILSQIELKDTKLQMGVKLLREACNKTNDKVGDGPQPLYSKILTPNGFVKMGDVKVGDEICGTDGTIQKVVGVFSKGKKQIFRVKFADNRVVECSGDHLWSVTDDTGLKRTITTAQLVKNGLFRRKTTNNSIQHKYFVPISNAEFNKNNLLLDPYLVGLLIGGGSLSGSGEIELSLGISKSHILDKIKILDGWRLDTKFIEKRNYFRVKIKGKTKNGLTPREAIKKLGLLGTKSDTKFIPKQYLYSDLKSRKKLLQGLSDTGGHINTRKLLELSTVSKRLSEDVQELLRGLGKITHCYLRDKTNDNSYSKKSIYRISELKGCKYGNTIIEIQPTGESTEMRCIKVSNQDNLYFTDDYVLTHNTTTTSVLTKHLVSSIVKDTDTLLIKEPIGDNIKLKKEINSGVKKVIDFIDKNKIEITGNRIKDIGTVSSNNKEIGNTLAELFSKLGKDAPILVSDNQTLETTHEIIEGMTIDKGFIAKAMVTNTEKSEAVLENANVLVTDYKIQNPQDLATLAQIFSPKFLGINDLLIIADDIQGVPLEFLIQNKMANMIRVIGVKAPALGDYKEILKDVAVLTGATLISKDAGMEFKDITADKLGKAARVVSTMEKTSIVGGAGTKEAIDMRVKEIENQLENTPMKFDQERLRERISKLGSGIGIIRVGGATETEVEEKKAKIDDAINAVRAALKDGGVPGGGVMLLRATSVLDVNIKGEEILHKAIRAPFEQIINNADLEPVKVREKIFASDNLNYGFNVETEEYTDLVESGIIDPALVAKTALTNAVSIALLILDISGANTLVREKEKKENEND